VLAGLIGLQNASEEIQAPWKETEKQVLFGIKPAWLKKQYSFIGGPLFLIQRLSFWCTVNCFIQSGLTCMGPQALNQNGLPSMVGLCAVFQL
jgi:hypothetical protein